MCNVPVSSVEVQKRGIDKAACDMIDMDDMDDMNNMNNMNNMNGIVTK